MITVRCLGHIGSAVGSEVRLNFAEIGAAEIVDVLRSRTKGPDPGFSRFNTLVMIGDGEAFVPAASSRVVKDVDQVVLNPFSHGG